MNFLNKMERRFGRYALTNLSLYIVLTYAAGYLLLLQLKRQQRIRTSLSASGKAKNRRDYPLMYFMMTERMILICLQLIFQANIL